MFSASKIATYARCPYKYFLKNELWLGRLEDFDSRALEWLDPMKYGSFLHELYFRFFIHLRDEKGNGFTSVAPSDQKVLLEEFEKLLQEYTVLVPVNSPLHFEADKARLKEDSLGFLEHEILNSNERLYFELAFNMPDTKGRDPSQQRNQPASVKLTDGTELLVRGSIDRIDREPVGRYILTDYKSGRPAEPKKDAVFGGGTLVQAGLYSEVAAQIDRQINDPHFRFYYATSDKGQFREYRIDYPQQRTHFLSLLTAIIREIRTGKFFPIAKSEGKEGVCGYCDFKSVCVERKQWLAERLQEGDPNFERGRALREEDV
jgi:ATP-dependent helicase/nuclease subunit B